METRIRWQDLTAKEVAVGRGLGITFRQLTDGKHFIQLIYDEDDKISDCEYLHQKESVSDFIDTFRKDTNLLTTLYNATLVELNGRLPDNFKHWMNYKMLRDECKKKHKELKKMLKARARSDSEDALNYRSNYNKQHQTKQRKYHNGKHSHQNHSHKSQDKHSGKNHSPENHSREKYAHKRHSPENHSHKKHSHENHSYENHSDEKNSSENHSQEKNSRETYSPENHSPENHSHQTHSSENHSHEDYVQNKDSPNIHSNNNHSYENHSPENHSHDLHQSQNHTHRHQNRKKRATSFDVDKSNNYLLFPGTLWCGRSDAADRYTALGMMSGTDKCCRRHDYCKNNIPGFSYRHGMFNKRPFTLSECRCDMSFRACLKRVGTSDANLVGKLFFNVVQTKCFVFKPKKTCVQRSWWGKCQKKKLKKQAVLRDNMPY